MFKADRFTNGNAGNGRSRSCNASQTAARLMPLSPLECYHRRGGYFFEAPKNPTLSALGPIMIGSKLAEGCPPFCIVSMLVSLTGYHSMPLHHTTISPNQQGDKWNTVPQFSSTLGLHIESCGGTCSTHPPSQPTVQLVPISIANIFHVSKSPKKEIMACLLKTLATSWWLKKLARAEGLLMSLRDYR